MKKILVVAMMALGFVVNAQDGKFNVGINLGLPMGDASDFTSFAIQPEINYLFPVADNIDLGASLSYSHFFGKDYDTGFGTIEGKDFSFLPIAAAARFNATEQFVLGADLGYGLAISPEGNDGGFYYRPMVGYNVSENMLLQLTYSGISKEGGSVNQLALGLVFGI